MCRGVRGDVKGRRERQCKQDNGLRPVTLPHETQEVKVGTGDLTVFIRSSEKEKGRTDLHFLSVLSSSGLRTQWLTSSRLVYSVDWEEVNSFLPLHAKITQVETVKLNKQ